MIYLITNRHLVSEEKYFKTLQDASLAGVDRIILREKDLNDEELERLYYKIKALVSDNTEIIINSNIKVFKKVEEKTLHLPFKDFMKFNSEKKVIRAGVSIHSVEEGIRANKEGCNYILASHIFPTKCKEGLEPKGVEFIRELKNVVTCPIIALGGISTENASKVIEAGADGIALMSTFFYCEDVYDLVRGLK
ncbi:thiamine phosphate synthase [Clostridium sp.]|uniref:thiamine phosphate synthase n=1 Tax=Clostridium sp. TaxID=1506 RepID=UPI003217F994